MATFPVETPLLRQLRIRLPLILAPMAGVSTPKLVADVSNSGGLGFYGVGLMPAATLRQELQQVKSLLNTPETPFGVNLFVPSGFIVPEQSWSATQHEAVREVQGRYASYAEELQMDTQASPAAVDAWAVFREQAAVLHEVSVPIVSFHFGWPPDDVISPFKDRGAFLIGCATSIAEAEHLESVGANAIIAQGSEAGGHQGTFLPCDTPSGPELHYRLSGMNGVAALVPSIAAAVSVPVIAAGGIMNGAGVAAALTLGAQAAQIGTAFITTPESSAPEFHKKALLEGRGRTPTVMSQAFTGKPARGLVNRLAFDLEEVQSRLPNCYNSLPGARPVHRAAMAAGRADLAPMWAGQGHALCRDLPAVELVRAIAEETADALAGMRCGV